MNIWYIGLSYHLMIKKVRDLYLEFHNTYIPFEAPRQGGMGCQQLVTFALTRGACVALATGLGSVFGGFYTESYYIQTRDIGFVRCAPAAEDGDGAVRGLTSLSLDCGVLTDRAATGVS